LYFSYKSIILIKGYLCFPEGCKEIEISPTKGSFQGKHEFKHATITNSSGTKRYVTSFLFYVFF